MGLLVLMIVSSSREVCPSPQYCVNLSEECFQRPALLMSCSDAPHRAAHFTQALRIE